MYQAKKSIQNKSLPALKRDFLDFLQNHTKVFCTSLGRWAFLNKQPQAILKRTNAKSRLSSFFVGIEILKHSKTFKRWVRKKEKGYSVKGLSREGCKVIIHLREETDHKKDKKLFLISVYRK